MLFRELLWVRTVPGTRNKGRRLRSDGETSERVAPASFAAAAGSASCRGGGRTDARLAGLHTATTAAIITGPARATKEHSRQSTSAAKAGTTVHRRQPTAAAAKSTAGPVIPIDIGCNGRRQGRRHRRHRQEELVADPTRTASRVMAADCSSSERGKPRS